jgi:hypothetical protein
MNGRVLENRRWNNEQSTEVLDVLSQSDTPALATDIGGHIVFWNRAAERLLGRPTNQVLGRRCYDVLGGHENCSVVSMTRKGEAVQGFEIVLGSSPKQEQNINVSILKIPGSRPELFTLVHILQPIDRSGRLTRALERLGAQRAGTPAGASQEGWEPVAAPAPVSVPKAPPLTDREKEILRWWRRAAGQEIAHKLRSAWPPSQPHPNILEARRHSARGGVAGVPPGLGERAQRRLDLGPEPMTGSDLGDPGGTPVGKPVPACYSRDAGLQAALGSFLSRTSYLQMSASPTGSDRSAHSQAESPHSVRLGSRPRMRQVTIRDLTPHRSKSAIRGRWSLATRDRARRHRRAAARWSGPR